MTFRSFDEQKREFRLRDTRLYNTYYDDWRLVTAADPRCKRAIVAAGFNIPVELTTELFRLPI